MPNRGDFEKEYNNDAEIRIANLGTIQYDDDDLDKNIKIAQIDSYIRQLVERQRQKRIICDYDLISEFSKQERPQATTSFRYTPQASVKLKRERELKEMLGKFRQLIPCTEFNDLISSITKERFLKDRIEQLEQLHKKGVTTLQGNRKAFQADVALKKTRSRRLRFRTGTPRDVRRWQHMRRWQKRWLGAAPSEGIVDDFDNE